MNTLQKLAAGTALLAAAAVVFTSCGSSDAETRKNGAAAEQAVSVTVETLQARDFNEIIKLTGAIAAFDDITVPAEEGGKILSWEVPRGARVRKGQLIARLDDALLKAAWQAADAQYQLAEITTGKQQKVFEEKGISEWQNKSFQYQRDAARAQADLARARLDKMMIRSPINGILDMRMADAGEMVGPGAPLARVIDNSRLKITAGVPERYAGNFSRGDQASFTIDAFPGESFKGSISFIGAAVSKDNRSIPVEITVPGNDTRLKPEMIASVSLTLSMRKNVVAVREDYLQLVDKDRLVAYVADGNVAEERVVQPGGSNNGFVLIKEGLKPGDQLITTGYQNVGNGQKIVVHK